LALLAWKLQEKQILSMEKRVADADQSGK